MRLVIYQILIMLSSHAIAQQFDLQADAYANFYNDLSLIDPSYIPKEGKYELITAYQYRIGPFRKIATFSGTAATAFRKDQGTAHLARAIFFNQQEGPFISSPRAYANYAYLLPVGEETFIAAGLALGFMGMYYTAPSSSGAGTMTIPDGGLGISLRRKDLYVGLSSLQVFNLETRPIGATMRIPRYYNLILGGSIDIDHELRLNAMGYYRWLPGHKSDTDIALTMTFKDLLSTGVIVNHNARRISFTGALHPKTPKSWYQVSFTYNSYLFSAIPSWFNSIELSLAYRFL